MVLGLVFPRRGQLVNYYEMTSDQKKYKEIITRVVDGHVAKTGERMVSGYCLSMVEYPR